MCGISAYAGKEKAGERVLSMLKRLEYRGYDSAGIAVVDELGISTFKEKGPVSRIEKLGLRDAAIAIGHTRWATHGEPSRENAHPHISPGGEIAIVHNGIIENYKSLRKGLENKFKSETDSEVIAHLIEKELKTEKDFLNAFSNVLKQLEGSYALLAVYSNEPEKIFFARKESPLILGLGNTENFIASDVPAFLPDSKKIIILEDDEYGFISAERYGIKDLKSGVEIEKVIEEVTIDVKAAEKGGYEHFMLKEIMEEPIAVNNALRCLDSAEKAAELVSGCGRICLVGCGTAYHAALAMRYFLQEKGIIAEAEVASEFRYSTAQTLDKDAVVVLVSQSGETADSIAVAKEAKRFGAKIVSIVNVVGSTLTRVSDEVIYTYSGPEIAVASTKAYIGQLASAFILGMCIAEKRGRIDRLEKEKLIEELRKIPKKIDEILDARETIEDASSGLSSVKDFFFIARGENLPTALEGALKLKEISYLHAEAYPAGELKHGPLALLEKGVCVVAINPEGKLQKKTLSNIEEAKSRGADVVEVCEGACFAIEKKRGVIRITVSKTESFTPLTMIPTLHLLAYYIAHSRGLDIDKPRNLAKSVTVE
jgi:glutamine---fructose-6-phosphate transaminase (isomerizing)